MGHVVNTAEDFFPWQIVFGQLIILPIIQRLPLWGVFGGIFADSRYIFFVGDACNSFFLSTFASVKRFYTVQQQILHLLCTVGSCRLRFSEHEHTLTPGSMMIAMASHVGRIEPSADCRLYRLLLPADQQASCMPRSSYGTCGWLHLFMHPIFHLEGEALALLEHDFEDVLFRQEHTPEAWRDDAVLAGMRTLYLDAMNAHAALFEHEEASQRSADIMSRFIRMLEAGSYRRHRTVAYYAQELCVSPKHLHKISTQVSGRSPSHWIQQFTVMEIRHLMMHGKLTSKEVAERMNFATLSHFSRYVKSIE